MRPVHVEDPALDAAARQCCVMQATVEAGYLVLQSILYVAVVYWMAGFISKPEQVFW